ncbi:L,D-transpeptidase family protein [Solimonas soli]|uniref:L,D-transpeptidase family protein n=1 Tax=Solimonas soli TaxID=413479 RepID=UPI0004AEC642|nr:L,D-transpeptidase family protein [Solimonas soli]
MRAGVRGIGWALAVVLAVGGAPVAAQPQADAQSIIAARAAPLRASGAPKLEVAPGIKGEALGLDEAVALFYGLRGDRPAWRDAQRRGRLLDALRGLTTDGLVPAQYHDDIIAAGPPPAGDAQALADDDWMVTHSALRALLDLYRGRVDPATLDTHWNFEPRALDARAGIEAFSAAVDRGDFADLYARARPQHWLYARMRAALAQLRAVQAAGGWPPIEAGPSIKPGADDPRVAALRRRLGLPDSGSTLYDEELRAAVEAYQQAQYLDADGVVGAATLAALNVPVAARIDQLRANLERGRWLLHLGEGDFVLVDIAGYRVTLFRAGEPVWQSRVQVGQPYRSTPVFTSAINYVTFNPTWTVPPTILRKDVLPKVRQDPGYLARHRIRVFDAAGRELSPAAVDWSRPGNITLRQDAGPDGSLGVVAIRFPNAYAVYLHDTPHQALFGKAQRAFSSGCIRVERAMELVERLYDDPLKWNRAALEAIVATGTTQNIPLPKPVPILLAYWTVDVDADGHPAFRPDIYQHDAELIAALDRRS